MKWAAFVDPPFVTDERSHLGGRVSYERFADLRAVVAWLRRHAPADVVSVDPDTGKDDMCAAWLTVTYADGTCANLLRRNRGQPHLTHSSAARVLLALSQTLKTGE
jgi:hypothetical protein